MNMFKCFSFIHCLLRHLYCMDYKHFDSLQLNNFINKYLLLLEKRKLQKKSLNWIQLLKFYYQDDPLLFRWEMLLVLLAFICGVPTIIVDLYGPSHEEWALRLSRDFIIEGYYF